MEYKVFKMDDCSFICAKSEEEAKKYFIEDIGANEEDLDIRECDIDESGMYIEYKLIEVIKKLKSSHDGSFEVFKRGGYYYMLTPYRKVIEDIIKESGEITEPFEIACTEW